ncbi:MAG TPA: universal stress protein [Verrucomicrobiae bacterium]|nr:universal stress protein [Verrucomicrobiae bacterium]
MKEATIELPEAKPPIAWKRILVPIDFTESSREAVKVAVCLAEHSDAKITLLHVVQLSSAETIETGTAAYEVMECAQRSLDEIAGEIPTAFVGQRLVCFSGAGISEKIIQTARELSTDLIVLVAHACGLFKRIFLGSTTEDVDHHAPCPVLVVRGNQNSNGKTVLA